MNHGPHAVSPDGGTVGIRIFSGSRITPARTAATILPLVDELAAEHSVFRYRLSRGWRHGPHLDVVARPDSGVLPWDQIAGRVTVPEPDPDLVLTPEAYLEQARETGRLEQVPPPYLPMEEHGTVRLLGADDVGAWAGPLQLLREQAQMRISGGVARTLRRSRDGVPTPLSVAEAMTSVAAAHPAGVPYGTFSFRSHAEAFLAWVRQTRDLRPVFEERRRSDGVWLRELVSTNLHGRHVESAGNQDWRDVLAGALGILDGGVVTGLLDDDVVADLSPEFDRGTMGPPGGDGRAHGTPSSFHETMRDSGVLDRPGPWFASYRMLLNLLYQQLPLLGVSPMQRYYLCYALAETTDEVLGETWQERIA